VCSSDLEENRMAIANISRREYVTFTVAGALT
jgi:hypothetical protein